MTPVPRKCRVDLGHLKVDDRIRQVEPVPKGNLPDVEAVPKGNRGEGHQGEEHGKKRGQGVERLVGAGRDDVLLGEHFDRIGDAVKQSQQAKAEDRRSVGADPILDQSGLFPLYPRMKPGQVQDREKNDSGQNDFDDQEFDHGTFVPGRGSVVATSTPSAPIVS